MVMRIFAAMDIAGSLMMGSSANEATERPSRPSRTIAISASRAASYPSPGRVIPSPESARRATAIASGYLANKVC